MKNMDRIGKFKNEYDFLSNFYEHQFEFEGRVFKTVEHAFQAYKTMDDVEFEEIMAADTPGRAKKLGRKCLMRRDWDDVKIDIMRKLVMAKFSSCPGLAKRLKDTAPCELIEGNTWDDTFWGVCNGVGENHLGRILMWVRSELMANDQGV
jgi:ribA/ribD-fused uncharacterized protein